MSTLLSTSSAVEKQARQVKISALPGFLDAESECSHQFAATCLHDVYLWIESNLGISAGTFELLCQGMLLSHPLEAPLPQPISKDVPLELYILKYNTFQNSSEHSEESGSDESDKDSDITSLDDDMSSLDLSSAMGHNIVHAKADMLATLAAMFPDMLVCRLADAVAASASLEEAIDMSLAMAAVDDDLQEDATVDTTHEATLPEARTKKKRRKNRPCNDDAFEQSEDKINLSRLCEMFPDKSPSTLLYCLKRNDDDVNLTIEKLLGDDVATFPNDRKAPEQFSPVPPGNQKQPLTISPSQRSSNKKVGEPIDPVLLSINYGKASIGHSNSFELLSTPTAAKKAVRVVASKARQERNKPNSLDAAIVASTSRRERQYRSTAALMADAVLLDPLPKLNLKSGRKSGKSWTNARTALGAELVALHEQRSRRFEQARVAIKSGNIGTSKWQLNGQVAAALADDGHRLTDAIRETEVRAGIALIRERQAAFRPDDRTIQNSRISSKNSNVIDLHGLNVRQAKLIVSELVSAWYEEEKATFVRPRNPFYIVVGVGKHSQGSSKLGPAIAALLSHEGYRFVDESRSFGRLIVTDQARTH